MSFSKSISWCVGYFFSSFFLLLSTCLMLCSGVGKTSGIVPPSSSMVWRTFLPTSKWVWLAWRLPCTWSRLSFSSAWVARNRLAASSVAAHMIENFLALFLNLCAHEYLWHPGHHTSLCIRDLEKWRNPVGFLHRHLLRLRPEHFWLTCLHIHMKRSSWHTPPE
ncbi:hypothetical protein SAMN05216318_1681 [Nitrosomonas eutropha]|nr:hypothetical protein SAMN05216318_1681 [Nitrosomonas eutropha]